MTSTYTEFERSLLQGMAFAEDNTGGSGTTLKFLAESRDFHFEADWISRAKTSLVDKGFIREIAQQAGEPVYVITPEGRGAVAFGHEQPRVARASEDALRAQFDDIPIEYEDAKYLLLLFVCDRFSDSLDEVGNSIEDPANYHYCYEDVAKDSDLKIPAEWMTGIVSDFHYYDLFGDITDNPDGKAVGLVNRSAIPLAEVLADKFFGSNGQFSKEEPASRQERSVPASDRYVSLDHNQPNYKQAITDLDAAIDAFRNDNKKDNELGREKSALLRALEAGRELLDDTRVSIETVSVTILEPLKIIAKRYDRELVAALATTALFAIAKLLGLV